MPKPLTNFQTCGNCCYFHQRIQTCGNCNGKHGGEYRLPQNTCLLWEAIKTLPDAPAKE